MSRYRIPEGPQELEALADCVDELDDAVWQLAMNDYPEEIIDEVMTLCDSLQSAHYDLTEAISQWHKVRLMVARMEERKRRLAQKWNNCGTCGIAIDSQLSYCSSNCADEDC